MQWYLGGWCWCWDNFVGCWYFSLNLTNNINMFIKKYRCNVSFLNKIRALYQWLMGTIDIHMWIKTASNRWNVLFHNYIVLMLANNIDFHLHICLVGKSSNGNFPQNTAKIWNAHQHSINMYLWWFLLTNRFIFTFYSNSLYNPKTLQEKAIISISSLRPSLPLPLILSLIQLYRVKKNMAEIFAS